MDISTDDGATWSTLWTANTIGIISAEVTTDRTQQVTQDVPWKYSYLIRVRMRAGSDPLDVGGYLLESVAQLFCNPQSLPALKPGENIITFHDESNTKRSVKVTYRWQEHLPISISKEVPLEGEEVILTARVSNNGKGMAKDIPVDFYLGDQQKGRTEIGRDFIGSIGPGETAFARVKWKATRHVQAAKRMQPSPGGAAISVIVDPDNSITESNKENNTSTRFIKVQNPPDVYIPSGSFIRFEQKKDDSDILTVTATVRNFSSDKNYGYYISDHADATGVVVKFFDGHPGNDRQIGFGKVIDRLQPLEFNNVSVDWDISRLSGFHKIYVQVLPGENVVKALGPQSVKENSTGINLDHFRTCASE